MRETWVLPGFSHVSPQGLMHLEKQGIISELDISNTTPIEVSATGSVPVIHCLKNNGLWLEPYQECEYMKEQTCLELDGDFNSCESPCRHSNARVCAAVCIPVCQFD